MPRSLSFPWCITALLVACASHVSLAQSARRCVGDAHERDDTTDPRARLESLRAPDSTLASIVHDQVTCDAHASSATPVAWRAVWPSLSAKSSGGLPDPRHDGAMWAGRGTTVRISGGLAADIGQLHAVLAPEMWYAQNLPFELTMSGDPARSPFASPFYYGKVSLDLPSRMGPDPLRAAGPGQSAIWYDFTRASVGASVSSQSWGTGRDALVLGNNSAGIPRLFVQMHPIGSRIGEFRGLWFAGRLTESRFFDDDPSNDARDIGAGLVEWTSPWTRAVSLALVHAVVRPHRALVPLRQMTDAFRPIDDTKGDEMTSLLAHGRSGDARLRGWVELAHHGPVRGRELLTAPSAGLGYRFGLEQAIERRGGAWLVLAEASNVEQNQDILDRPVHDFYTGFGTAQGWTQRGQLLGDGTGPGSQTQFLSADWVAPRWRAGVFGERIRWNEDALFRQYLPYPTRHDVTLRAGARIDYRLPRYDVGIEAATGRRLNYLFQNGEFFAGNFRTVDIVIPELRVTLSPRPRGGA